MRSGFYHCKIVYVQMIWSHLVELWIFVDFSVPNWVSEAPSRNNSKILEKPNQFDYFKQKCNSPYEKSGLRACDFRIYIIVCSFGTRVIAFFNKKKTKLLLAHGWEFLWLIICLFIDLTTYILYYVYVPESLIVTSKFNFFIRTMHLVYF